jgi:anti-sigma regulatory factor (Ser/Thr protein kinase)
MTSSRTEISLGDHRVRIHRDDATIVGDVVASTCQALSCGRGVVIIATSEHRIGFADGLRAAGISVDAAQDTGQLLWLDAAEVAKALLAGDAIDNGRFEQLIARPVHQLVQRFGAVHAYGEIVAVLWAQGQVLAALELEQLWDGLIATLPLSLLCGYPADVVESGGAVADYQALCTAHSHVESAPPTLPLAEVNRQFPRTPAALREVRRFVRDTLHSWHRGSLAESATFVVNELASNAVEHAGSEFSVSLSRDDDAVHVAVGDCAPSTAPLPMLQTHSGEGGRGIQLVTVMCADWGQDATPDGKLVWARVSAEPLE